MTCPSGLTRRPNVLSLTHRVIHAITNWYATPIDGEHRLADEMEPASRDTGGILDETGEDAGEDDAGDAACGRTTTTARPAGYPPQGRPSGIMPVVLRKCHRFLLRSVASMQKQPP